MSCCATGGANAVPRAESAPVLPPLHLRGVVDTRHGNGGASPAHQGHQTGQRATSTESGCAAMHTSGPASSTPQLRRCSQDWRSIHGPIDRTKPVCSVRATQFSCATTSRSGWSQTQQCRHYPAGIGRIGIEPHQRLITRRELPIFPCLGHSGGQLVPGPLIGVRRRVI